MESTQTKVNVYRRLQRVLWLLPIVKLVTGMTLLRAAARWGSLESPGELTGHAIHAAAPKGDRAAHFCSSFPNISPQWYRRRQRAQGEPGLPSPGVKLGWELHPTGVWGLEIHQDPVNTPSQSMYIADTKSWAPTIPSVD